MDTYPKLSPLLFYDQRRDLQKRNSSTNREVCCPSYKKQRKEIALLQMLWKGGGQLHITLFFNMSQNIILVTLSTKCQK